MLIVMSIAAFRVQGPARWPFFFATWGIITWWATATAPLQWFFYQWLQHQQYRGVAGTVSLCTFAVLLSTPLAFAVIRDLRDRKRHDWLHRTGLVIAFLYWGCGVVRQVGYWVLGAFLQQ